MMLTPLECALGGLGVGAALVWAWADTRIGELRDALGELPRLYAEALEERDDAIANAAEAEAELEAVADLVAAGQRVTAHWREVAARRARANARGIAFVAAEDFPTTDAEERDFRAANGDAAFVVGLDDLIRRGSQA